MMKLEHIQGFESFTKSNTITENTFKNKLDKNKFNERIFKRLNSIYGKGKLSNEVYDNRSDPVL